ncbi:alpha/beta fold hydrolase [Oceanicoccus sagamiensis]|nr:alpha/beta hydrolase [Oceanicoccus sagamiensis]
MSAIRRGYIDTRIGQIHYREAGNSDLPSLVMFHQVPSTSAMYEVLMERLANQFHIIAPDMPGFGGSDALNEAVTIKAYADILHEALLALGIHQCLVFGHHTGASVAVQLEYDFPGFASKIALSGPTLLDQALKDLLPKKSFAFPVEDNGSHLMLMWERVRAKDPDATLALSQRETLTGIALGDTYPDAYKAVIDQDYATQLASVKCPVLAFAGTEDPLLGQLDNALALVENGEKAIIEGARTYVCERNADEVSALLTNFFK